MPKNCKAKTGCPEQFFSLKPIKDKCYYSQAISISFCKNAGTKKKIISKKNQNKECLQIPIFNKDNNYATSSFILSSEKNYYEENGHQLKEQHNKKMVNYTDSKSVLCVPKPRSKSNYCSVCRTYYQEYIEHIEHLRHKNKIQSSIFNHYINQMAKNFKKIRNQKIHRIKNSNSTFVEINQSSEDVEILENPKIKYEEPIFSYQNLVFPTINQYQIPLVHPFSFPPHIYYPPAYFPNPINYNTNLNMLMNNPLIPIVYPGSSCFPIHNPSTLPQIEDLLPQIEDIQQRNYIVIEDEQQ